MIIDFYLIWKVKVDYMGQFFYIEAASGNIRCNKQLKPPLSKLAHYILTLILGQITMESISTVTFFNHLLCDIPGRSPGLTENNAVNTGIEVYKPLKSGKLVTGMNGVVLMGYSLSSGVFLSG
jgi:hypothetical protein